MRAILRLITIVAVALMSGSPALLHAQESPPTDANQVVGPRELRDFSLPGTRTRPAEPQPAAPAPTPTTRPEPSRTINERSGQGGRQLPTAPSRPERAGGTRSEASSEAPASQPVLAKPGSAAPVPDGASRQSLPLPLPAARPEGEQSPLAPSWLMWLAPALLLGGLAFLFLRRRHALGLVGGPEFAAETEEPLERAEHLTPNRPAQLVPSTPAAAAAATPTAFRAPAAGIVSTRLRPWLEIEIQPLRCILDERQFTLELEIELLNSGSSPARAVLAEAVLISSPDQQDQQITAFFNRPAVAGGQLETLAPLQRMVVRNQLVAARGQLQPVEVGGRQLLVPVVAVDVRYRTAGGEGQSAIARIIGRDTGAEKLAPISLDLVPRVYRTLGSRPLPQTIRR